MYSRKVKKVDILIPQNAVKDIRSSTTIEISLEKGINALMYNTENTIISKTGTPITVWGD